MKKYVLIFVMLLLCSTLAMATSFRTSEGLDLQITMLNQDPDPVSPSSYVDVRFKIENYGNTPLQNGFFKIIPELPLEVDGSVEKSIGSIKGNQQGNEGVIVKFRLKVDSNAVEGSVPIDVAYKSGDDGKWIKKEGYYVEIESSNKLLSIEKYDVIPSRLKAGDQGKVDVFLKNLADTDLKEIKVTLTTDDNILPIGNTNEKVIDILDRNNQQVLSFNIIVSSSTISGVYSIPVDITYKDFKENEYTVSNIISLIVDNNPELLINLDETSIKEANTKGTVLVSISNSGVSDLKFVSYELKETEDYTVLSTPFVYIGNIDSDDFETVESEVYLKDIVDRTNLEVEIKYKDSFNKDYTVSKNIPLTVFSHEELIKYGYVTPENKSKLFFSLAIGVILMVYWLFMLIDLLKRKMVMYKKLLWLLILIIGLPLGAIIYQFFGKGRGNE